MESGGENGNLRNLVVKGSKANEVAGSGGMGGSRKCSFYGKIGVVFTRRRECGEVDSAEGRENSGAGSSIQPLAAQARPEAAGKARTVGGILRVVSLFQRNRKQSRQLRAESGEELRRQRRMRLSFGVEGVNELRKWWSLV